MSGKVLWACGVGGCTAGQPQSGTQQLPRDAQPGSPCAVLTTLRCTLHCRCYTVRLRMWRHPPAPHSRSLGGGEVLGVGRPDGNDARHGLARHAAGGSGLVGRGPTTGLASLSTPTLPTLVRPPPRSSTWQTSGTSRSRVGCKGLQTVQEALGAAQDGTASADGE